MKKKTILFCTIVLFYHSNNDPVNVLKYDLLSNEREKKLKKKAQHIMISLNLCHCIIFEQVKKYTANKIKRNKKFSVQFGV